MSYGDITNFSVIYAQFMSLVDDYRLLALYQSSVTDYETYLGAWLKLAIVDFTPYCTQDLTQIDWIAKRFNLVLTDENTAMLSFIMQKYWMRKETQNSLQMKNVVQDKDFTRHSESQNLTAKMAELESIQEDVSQRLMDYKVAHYDWTAFAAALMA